MKTYPYFLYPVISELKFCTDPERAEELKCIIASNVGDYDTLLALTGNLEEDLRNFYPNRRDNALNTEDTIDSFIAKFSTGSPAPVVAPLLDEFDNPEPDRESPLSGDSIGETFTESIPGPQQQIQTDDSDKLMEKVKLLVKNQDYNEALEIMESFYLNNPKKSINFADQIRMVKKMISEESKKK